MKDEANGKHAVGNAKGTDAQKKTHSDREGNRYAKETGHTPKHSKGK